MGLRPAAVAGLLLLTFVPAASGDPYGTDCSDPATYETAYGNVQCSTILGPGTAAVFDASQFPGAGPAGADWNGGVQVDVWAKWVTGICGVPNTGDFCGFDIMLCNDRYYDGTCTDLSVNYDQLRTSTSNEPLPVDLSVAGIPNNTCEDQDKDLKDCDNILDATVGACFGPAAPANGVDTFASNPWNFGQIVVFIGNWVDAWPGTSDTIVTHPTPTNVGAGTSAGFYEVWMAATDGCIAPGCSDNLDNPGSSAGTDYGLSGGDPDCASADCDEGSPCPTTDPKAGKRRVPAKPLGRPCPILVDNGVADPATGKDLCFGECPTEFGSIIINAQSVQGPGSITTRVLEGCHISPAPSASVTAHANNPSQTATVARGTQGRFVCEVSWTGIVKGQGGCYDPPTLVDLLVDPTRPAF